MKVIGLGRMPYAQALELQRELAHRRLRRAIPHDMLLLVEHPPVITLGRGTHAEHLLAPAEFRAAKGVELFEVDRGGDVTYHGPGQLVGYPIFDLTEHRTDLHWFLRAIETGLIVALEGLGVSGERRDGYTGVWTAGRKIASIGIHVKQWVTWHGFALNVATDLSAFDLIIPCGIPGVEMTSIQRELSERSPRDLWGQTLDRVVGGFAEVFHREPQMALLDELLQSSRERTA